jgi:hypothetical protein
MKKLLVLAGILLLVSAVPAFAQLDAGDPPTFFADYYANNAGPVPSATDQVVRIINSGLYGTPLTSPVGDICANIYVFDNNQEMISCCSCRITPNGLASASVGLQLTNNPVTSVVPAAGVIKIVATPLKRTCDPTARIDPSTADDDLAVVFGTHVQTTAGTTSVTETNIGVAPLGSYELDFLPTACTFAQYLGSGKGTCGCSVPGL